MGKKGKVGKQRKDKYYQLAKEAGYRSRAAFKLIQLNRRFEFLQNSRALVDLCAAPGGWLQVATQNMPVSSIRIGVDLVPIRAVPNCITLQGDITEEKTRHMVKKELQTWEADCVLHDGAPNMGVNWSHDAFQQNCLTLYALRLATQVLKRGGYFVTKIFRSSDYSSLVDVFKRLFKQVHVWKPEASRLESAEIFVVCEHYFKPAKVDPELLDVKKVFKQVPDEKPAANPMKMLVGKKKDKKAKAEGYADGDVSLFYELKASDFLKKGEALQQLCTASCITIDQEEIGKSPHTTDEIRECLKDIKVCGARELRSVLAWRKRLLADQRHSETASTGGNDEERLEATPEEEEMRELEEMDDLVRSTAAEEKTKSKRLKRKAQKEKMKQQEREEYDMNRPKDDTIQNDDIELFSLRSLKRGLKRKAPQMHDDEPAVEDKRSKKLSPEELAMGEQLIYSSKTRGELEDWAWNKYTNNDTGLPAWFVEDESKHCNKELPVSKERVEFYKQRQMELNARPIKKVVEAKMRKRKRQLRQLEKAKKRANNLMENENLSHNERLREMKSVYKRVLGSSKKKDVKYQVMTKGKRGSLERPNGPYRVVDRRLKKDNRGKSGRPGGKRAPGPRRKR